MNNLIKGFALFVFAIGMGLVVFRFQISNRGPASVQGLQELAEKAELIHALSWREYGTYSKLSMYSDQTNFCESYTSMEVTFRSEGIAYSGEPDRVIQSSDCQDQGFQQDWPQNMMDETANLKRVGVFQEAPEGWAIETVKLSGPAGLKIMTGPEIYKQTGRVPLLQQ